MGFNLSGSGEDSDTASEKPSVRGKVWWPTYLGRCDGREPWCTVVLSPRWTGRKRFRLSPGEEFKVMVLDVW